MDLKACEEVIHRKAKSKEWEKNTRAFWIVLSTIVCNPIRKLSYRKRKSKTLAS